jgi:hypothetical protein
MKLILCVFFGLMAGVGSVCGQLPAPGGYHQGLQLNPDSLAGGGYKLGLTFSPDLAMLNSDSVIRRLIISQGRASVRIMQPDNMPCVVIEAGRVDRMPVRRMKSSDRMPNGIRIPEKQPMPGQDRP